MAITFGTEVAFSIHLDSPLSYGEIESSLLDAGFSNYTIMRNLNYYDQSCDVQLFVRNAPDSEGNSTPLPAAETLNDLATALAAMADSQASNQS